MVIGLRRGTSDAALGADEDLRDLVARLRAVWPDVRIHIRGDSGFGVPKMYDVCRELELSYTFCIDMNSRLKSFSEDLLQQAVEQYEQTGVTQCMFMLVDYQSEGWYMSQPVVIKAEGGSSVTRLASGWMFHRGTRPFARPTSSDQRPGSTAITVTTELNESPMSESPV